MLRKKPQLIVILGPTASGKSELALKLAKKFNGEIVSADSRQIYKKMNIGTNKIKNKKLSLNEVKELKVKSLNNKVQIINNIPHYMIDIINPNKEFSLAKYKKMTIKIIKNIQKQGKIPFLVGGTGLYISSIINNFQIPKVPPNTKLREKIENEIKKYGIEKVYQKLLKLDPETEKFVQKNNARRIIRALEVCLSKGKLFSQQRQKNKPLFRVLQLGIKTNRKKLLEKINQRVDQMIKDGLIKEVTELAKKYNWNLQSMSGIGYKQMGMYLRNEINLDETIELIKRDTRRYARRQMTWFKKDDRINWISNQKQSEKLIANFL
ncbi:tRNA (adenosine(37)-N6)-dimethylallyltransferase MiaA [Candidatus Kuenenbacteria bacterium HGW-Kuenenbacteria-1]|uniref:tRNA dimethylallyltransferase n=1 Tax=Candidatus Kuenenbacteria bacterium HGW-Kuenenbacteria-1 TaxID=2013812 RepID=A0A2N1UP99_9BACT|nr:MAG: tRNA (adenosine(37)-N6)-dimethylallyltransferase MiaA [Candidatus Kuenenbacteria bacterium HGW-Kuenenbacteria-1]